MEYWKLSLLFILLTTASCTKHVAKVIVPGHSTIHEAIEEFGNPKNIRISQLGSEEEIFEWDEFELLVEKKLVKSYFRAPVDQEIHLQYWRNKFHDAPSEQKTIRSPASEEFVQIHFPTKGMSVVYDKKLSKVTRVIGHAAKF
jgi:hypothetical protein